MCSLGRRIFLCALSLRKIGDFTRMKQLVLQVKPEVWPITSQPLFHNLYSTHKHTLDHEKSSNLRVDEENDAINEAVQKDEQTTSILSPSPKVEIPEVAKPLPSTFNLAAYVNTSLTLQKLLDLGVELHKFDSKPEISEFILKLDFEKDIKPFVQFLCDNGVQPEFLGNLITLNPLLFKEDLEDLQVRINYLESKKFTKEMIARILSTNPYWLMFSVKQIDSRLGHFQVTFNLSGNQVRDLATKSPKLITYKLSHVRLIHFVVKEEMGFDDAQVKKLLLTKPKIFRSNQASLLARFEFVHNEMNIPHLKILEQPHILTYRVFIIKQRHLFLKSLGRAQYNENLPGYVSLNNLISGTDAEFCENVAKSSVHTFNMFMKTI